MSRDSCRPIFIQKKILTFPSVYIYRNLLHARDNIGKFLKNSFHHKYDTRNADSYSTVGHDLAKFERSPDYACVRLFNKYVQELSFKEFKTSVKNLLLTKGYYSVGEYMTDAL